jgi:hypothetical protein
MLPDEILLEILSHLKIDDFVNLSRVSRRIHPVAIQRLYKNIRVPFLSNLGKYRTSKIEKFWWVFQSYPERASWINSADFSWWEEDERTFEYIHNYLSKCTSIVELRLYTCHQSLRPGFYDKLRRTNRRFNLYKPMLQLPFAASLRRLSIDDCNMLYTDLDTIFSLPALGYVKIAQYNDMVSRNFYLPFYPLKGPPKSACTLKKLEIWWSPPPVGVWQVYILKPHTQLQKLTWIGGRRFHDRCFTPGQVSTNLSFLKHTLVELRLSLPVYHYGMRGGLADFSEFTKLKVLDVDFGMMMCSDTLHFLRSPQFKRTPLKDRLPRSLESLTVS